MRDAPEPYLVVTPEFPNGISTEEWKALSDDKRTDVARFWYMSNYQPNMAVGPDGHGRDRSDAFRSGASTWNYTNMTEYICGIFGPTSLAIVGTNVEEALHPISRAWTQAFRLEIYTEEELLLRAIQLAAAGIKHEYAEVERRLNSPGGQILKISEMKDLIQAIREIVAATENREREAASQKIGFRH